MADYQGVLADLRGRLAVVEVERSELTTAIAAIGRIEPRRTMGVAIGAPGTAHAGLSRQPFRGLTMPRAIAEYFQVCSEPQTIREIMDGLVAGGFKKVGKNFRGHVYNTMHRLSSGDSAPYRHEADGKWSAQAWSHRAPGEVRS